MWFPWFNNVDVVVLPSLCLSGHVNVLPPTLRLFVSIIPMLYPDYLPQVHLDQYHLNRYSASILRANQTRKEKKKEKIGT